MAQLMKGQTWQDAQKLVRGKPRFEYPVYAEVKLDEIRCRVLYSQVTKCVAFESYAGKPLHNLGRFAAGFEDWFERAGYSDLDCGILVNGNFNDSYRWVRSSKGIPEDLADATVEIIVFDVPDDGLPFSKRIAQIDRIADALKVFHDLPTVRPEIALLFSEEAVLRMYRSARERGFEGLMVKTREHLYSRTRTWDWLKLKPKETHDAVITEVVQARSIHGELLDRAGSVRVTLEDGSEATPSGIGHELGRDMLSNPDKYIGQWVEFTRMEEDRQGGSRHPIFKRLREAKA